jgi:hypothetical protein
MIASRERSTPNEAGREFREWASLFSKGLFVHIVAYADDSGTHDETGVQKGSREAILGGVVACREDWVPFCEQWQRVLNKYDVEFFHFREWSTASAVARKIREAPSDFSKNPYRNLDEKHLNSFLIELAVIAGSGNKLIVGGSVYTRRVHELKRKGEFPVDAYPYQVCVKQFFEEFAGMIQMQRAPWKRQPVHFFFDQSDNKQWIHAVIDTFCDYQKQHPKWQTPTFRDKKQRPYLPLQAADMVAYRLRYITEKWVDNDALGQWPEH